jgi:thiamine-monophosphate kinase
MAAHDQTSAEDKLIARFFAPIAIHPGALGLSDDAAFITPPPGCDLVLKADAIVGGVHFLPDDAAQTVASKALRVNLSDLAAKGAKPLGFLLSLALPTDIEERWLANFAEGLRGDAVLYGCPLFGGDTDRTPGPMTVSIAMFGSVPEGTMVRRAGAKPGDRVFVSGTIGDAALGLVVRKDKTKAKTWNLSEPQRQFLLARYLLPQPRNALAEAVRKHASAAMDVSDGLAGDFAKLCRASKVSATIAVEHVPLSDAARTVLATDPAMREVALTGGDDYEIVCAVPPHKVEAFRDAAKAVNVMVTDIGDIGEGEGARFLADGHELTFEHASYSHF